MQHGSKLALDYPYGLPLDRPWTALRLLMDCCWQPTGPGDSGR